MTITAVFVAPFAIAIGSLLAVFGGSILGRAIGMGRSAQPE
ncbi:hypothetical protein [Micromonospora sp. NBC_00389]